MTAFTLPRRRRRPLRRFVISLVIALTFALGVIVLFEDHMIYFPTRYPVGRWDTTAVDPSGRIAVSDCWFTADDGVGLHGWWAKPPVPASGAPATADLVVLFFHGNAGNLSDRAEILLALASLPVQVLMVDYRGYGRSAGRPSEAGLYRDARAAWRYLTAVQGVAPSQIVLYGESLGGAVAIELATAVEPAALIVQSSFTSVPALAARYYPFVPGFLIRTKMDSLARITEVRCPVLVAHSPSDEIVPYTHGRTLFDAASEPKRFHEITGAGHNTTWLVGGRELLATLGDFLRSLDPGSRN